MSSSEELTIRVVARILELADNQGKLREIFDRKILKLGNKIFIVLYDKERVILKLNNQKWEGVTFEEEKMVVETLRPDISEKSKYIGFIEYDIKHNKHVFKTRNTIKETHKGAKCDEMGKGIGES